MKIYMDHASTTAVDGAVIDEMKPFWANIYGNPASQHAFGRDAAAAVDKARDQISRFLQCQYGEVYFTSGATESNNLAILGIFEASMVKFPEITPHVIVSSIEHPSVLDTCKELEKRGAEVTYLPVDESGILDKAVLKSAIKEQTILVCIMHTNNEVGTVQPIRRFAKYLDKVNKKRLELFHQRQIKNELPQIHFHVDATQAAPYFKIHVDDLLAHSVSLSAHKVYGPKGIGVLYIRSGSIVRQQVFGGGQERGIRPGTVAVPLAIGAGKAFELATLQRGADADYVSTLRDNMLNALLEIECSHLNGDRELRSPNNVNISFDGISAERLLLNLDMKGLAVSHGSACSSGSMESSHVLTAMGLSKERCDSAIRITLGRHTTQEEVDKAVKIIKTEVSRLRK